VEEAWVSREERQQSIGPEGRDARRRTDGFVCVCGTSEMGIRPATIQLRKLGIRRRRYLLFDVLRQRVSDLSFSFVICVLLDAFGRRR
jgi:hypothetical protein